MTDTNLDRAAQMAGYTDWDAAEREAGPWTKDRTKDHAATLDELDAAKAELEAFKREVSDAVEALIAASKAHDAVRPAPAKGREFRNHCCAVDDLRRFILPRPDPLVEALSEAMCGIDGEDYIKEAEALRAALAKHGLKLERIEHE